MSTPDSIAIIDAYWRKRTWCEEEVLAGASTVVRGFPADPSHRFNVIASHRLGGGCVIDVHDHLLPAIEQLGAVPAAEAFHEERLRHCVPGHRITLEISAAQAYADVSDLHEPHRALPVTVIESVDDPLLARLRDSCSDGDWREASMDEAQPPVFATIADGEIAGAAHAIANDGIRKIGVLTHPSHRRQGHSRAAAAAMIRHFTAEGAVMEWQARLSNASSIAVRDALGFTERYRTIVLKVE